MSQPMALTPGTKLGPYEILAPLGAGGMGEVYRAKDTRLDRTVAIKVLPARLSGNPDARDRFQREARAISSLNHPNICHLYDVGVQDSTSYLVMEFPEGQTLAARLRKGPLPLEQFFKIAIDICEGLEKAHHSGVIHRDLKPGNVMLTKSVAKLMDFGLAKALPTTASLNSTLTASFDTPVAARSLTAQGTIVGTFQYMSPEQLEGKEVNACSDIFSLGAVLYEMVTGRLAFEGETPASKIAAILATEPTPMSRIQPLIPPALERVVRTCLAKDPDHRFQSVHDLKLQLIWMAGPESEARATRVARKSGIAVLAASAFLFLLAIGTSGWMYFHRQTSFPSVVRAAIPPPDGADFYSLYVEAGRPAISPDGKQLAFVARQKTGSATLWVRRLDLQTSKALAGTEGAGHPFWSADSRSIGFFANGKLRRIEADGASSQTICEAGLSPRGGAWNQNGVIIFTPGISEGLYRVSAEGGVPVLITQPATDSGEDSHRWPQFLPDGNHYLFFLRSSDKSRTGIYVSSLDSKGHRMVLNTGYGATYAAPGYLLFMRDQSLVAQRFDPEKAVVMGEPVTLPDSVSFLAGNSQAMFSASQNGEIVYYPGLSTGDGWELLWYDAAGHKIGSIGRDFFLQPAVSPDATKVAVGIYDGQWWTPDIWIFDLARGTKIRFTNGPGVQTAPTWQPDGQSVDYASAQKGFAHIYHKSVNSSGDPEVLLATDGVNETPRSFCRDGRYLAYTRQESGKAKHDAWILPLFGDRKPFPLMQSQLDAVDHTFSPDCKWVAFMSLESRQPEVYVASFPGGTRRYQVSTGGGSNPRWRADGKELYFLGPLSGDLTAVAVQESGQELKLGTPRILFATHAIGSRSSGRLGTYDSDGKRFLVNGDSTALSNVPLTLVLNWDAELKQ
jgi:eukaryotic-like serine/threonine-protein kinase